METLQDAAATVQSAQQQVTVLTQQLAGGRAMFDQQTATIKDMLAKQEATYEANAKPINDQLALDRNRLVNALLDLQNSIGDLLGGVVILSLNGDVIAIPPKDVQQSQPSVVQDTPAPSPPTAVTVDTGAATVTVTPTA